MGLPFQAARKSEALECKIKFLSATIMLEGDLCKAFEDAAFSDDDVRLAEEFIRALYKASIVVLPVDYSEKRKENIFEITKPRN